jgi:alkylation response protein AidB-like acyl-CoA dehydrogenase
VSGPAVLRDEAGLGRSAEQEQFGAALHELLSQADVPGAARAWTAGDRGPGLAVWRELAGLGVTGLAVPERCGGAGASPLDLVVACQELGHHAVPGPMAESLAAVPALLAGLAAAAPDLATPAHPTSPAADRTGPDLATPAYPTSPATDSTGPDLASRCARWLSGLAAGDLLGTLAAPPRLPYAADGDAAGLVLLVSARSVWLARAGTRHRSVDGTRWLADVHGTELLASPEAAAGAVHRAVQAGTLASAAQLLGAGRALLEISVRHATERAQFGRPIGSFQAVKHRLADVAIGLEFARPLLDAAAVTVAVGNGANRAADRDVSAAKVACADAAYRAARTALQVHGAIGYTEEHDLSLWLAKVRALVPAWGSQAEHRAVVLAAVTGFTGGAERRSGAGGNGGSPPGKQSGGSSPRAGTDSGV